MESKGEADLDDAPADDGEIGEILVRDLLNRAMPLIRYKIGDMGIPLAGACACERNFPLMDMTAGCVADFLVSGYDGSYISPISLCNHLLVEGPQIIGNIQIIQHALDRLKMKIPDGSSSKRRETHWLAKTLKRIVGKETEVATTFVREIPREKSGKYRFVISKVPLPWS